MSHSLLFEPLCSQAESISDEGKRVKPPARAIRAVWKQTSHGNTKTKHTNDTMKGHQVAHIEPKKTPWNLRHERQNCILFGRTNSVNAAANVYNVKHEWNEPDSNDSLWLKDPYACNSNSQSPTAPSSSCQKLSAWGKALPSAQVGLWKFQCVVISSLHPHSSRCSKKPFSLSEYPFQVYICRTTTFCSLFPHSERLSSLTMCFSIITHISFLCTHTEKAQRFSAEALAGSSLNCKYVCVLGVHCSSLSWSPCDMLQCLEETMFAIWNLPFNLTSCGWQGQ